MADGMEGMVVWCYDKDIGVGEIRYPDGSKMTGQALQAYNAHCERASELRRKLEETERLQSLRGCCCCCCCGGRGKAS